MGNLNWKSTKGEILFEKQEKHCKKAQLSVIGIFHQQNVYVLAFGTLMLLCQGWLGILEAKKIRNEHITV